MAIVTASQQETARGGERWRLSVCEVMPSVSFWGRQREADPEFGVPQKANGADMIFSLFQQHLHVVQDQGSQRSATYTVSCLRFVAVADWICPLPRLPSRDSHGFGLHCQPFPLVLTFSILHLCSVFGQQRLLCSSWHDIVSSFSMRGARSQA